MLTKTITYDLPNLAGGPLEQVTETFYFGFSQADIVKMQLSAEGNDFHALLKQIVASNNGKLIMQHFEEIIAKSYGEKTADGKGFRHSEELSANFMAKDAYNRLFMELVTDANAAGDFINGIMPANMEELANTKSSDGTPLVAPAAEAATDGEPQKRKIGDYTQEELLNMSDDDFFELVGHDETQWSQPVMMVAYRRKMQTK